MVTYMVLLFPVHFPFLFPSQFIKRSPGIFLLGHRPNRKKTFCKPPDSCLLRERPGDLVRKAGVVGGQPSKQTLTQLSAADRVRLC